VIPPGRHFEKIDVSVKESIAELPITCGRTEVYSEWQTP